MSALDPERWTLWRLCRLAIGLGLLLAVAIFGLLVALPAGTP